MTENLKFLLERVEKIVGKGENAGYQHLLLFLQCFQKASFQGSLITGIVWERVKTPLDSSNPPISESKFKIFFINKQTRI